MHVRQYSWIVAAVVLAAGVALPTRAAAQDAEIVIEWNRVLQTAVTTPGALPPPVFVTRPYALMHAAVFDAINAIDRTYTSLGVEVSAAPTASRGAAVAQAAHDVLAAMMPSQRAAFDAALETMMGRFQNDAGREGARVGAEVARRWIELRAQDGWTRTPPQFLMPSLPGYYQPTPPQNAAAAVTHYPDVVPFVIGSARQFMVEQPPSLSSARYAADFNEVKALGSATSATRTADQTLVGQLWASAGTPTQWHQILQNVARDLTRARGLNDVETARLFALMNIGIHDGLFVTFTGKFLYGFWRPVTAVRAAADDGNPATEPDPGWLPLVGTPPYPTYPGNMACLSAASARILERFFGRDDIAFTATWTMTGGIQTTRRYNGFRELADEAARSRVYGGIHFTFDSLASQGVCTPLGEYVFANAARPRVATR
jgi:hypothetical protein